MANDKSQVIESTLRTITAVGAAAAVVASVFKWALGVEVPTAVIVIVILGLIALQWFYAGSRLAQNKRPQFPSLFWQVVFNEPAATRGQPLAPLQLALIHAPAEGESFAVDFTAPGGWKQRQLTLPNLRSDSLPKPGNRPQRFVVTLEDAEERDRPLLWDFLRRINGLALIYTRAWASYPWVLTSVSRWARRYPECPFVVIHTDRLEPPDELAWANREVVKGDLAEWIGQADIEASLLRQAVSRHNSFRRYASLVRAVAGVAALAAAVSLSGTWLLLKREKDASARDINYSAVSSQALKHAAKGARATRELGEELVSAATADSEEGLDKAALARRVDRSVEEYESFVEDQVFRSHSMDVDAVVFVRKTEGETECLCEARLIEGDVDCFDIDSSVVSCAASRNLVVLWKRGGESRKGELLAWNLLGDAVDATAISECRYARDETSGGVGSRAWSSSQERSEIMCLPLVGELNPQDAVPSDVALCVSREVPGDVSLAERKVRRDLILTGGIVGSLPWTWYAEVAPHVNCQALRR